MEIKKTDLVRLINKYKTDKCVGKIFGVSGQMIYLKRKLFGIKAGFGRKFGERVKSPEIGKKKIVLTEEKLLKLLSKYGNDRCVSEVLTKKGTPISKAMIFYYRKKFNISHV